MARLDTEGAGGWVSGDFAAGDVILFGMHTLHMSTANLTDRVRVSCDVRWQSAAEAIDERDVGTAEELREKQAQRKKGGAWAAAGAGAGGAAEAAVAAAAVVTIADLKAKWGL
jgi:ectoine hydroxylase-related dioxygenase (phytanoyl-CoA dioxygenase family)